MPRLLHHISVRYQLLPARPSFRPKTGCVFSIGPQKETVSRFGAGTAENWTVIWFGLEYA